MSKDDELTDHTNGDDTSTQKPGLTVPWGGLSLSLGVFSIACLVTLVVIVAVKKVDVLSTVALSLAVLSFAAQLVVTLLQAQASAQQLSETGRVNAETRAILSQINAQSGALLSNQTDQFNRVLEAAIGPDAIKRAVRAATPEDSDSENPADTAGSSAIDTVALAESLEASVRRALADQAGSDHHAPNTTPLKMRRTLRRAKYADFIKTMTTFPSPEHGRHALEVLRTLTVRETAELMNRAQSDLEKARRGVQPRAIVRDISKLSPETARLKSLGLIDYSEYSDDGHTRYYRTLTPLGRDVARLQIAPRPVPEWLKEMDK